MIDDDIYIQSRSTCVLASQLQEGVASPGFMTLLCHHSRQKKNEVRLHSGPLTQTRGGGFQPLRYVFKVPVTQIAFKQICCSGEKSVSMRAVLV